MSNDSSNDPRVGTLYGRYRIERVVGRGGFGTVYLAEDTNPHLPRRVALKILSPELSTDPLFRERFLRESVMAIELDHHPNIVPVYDAGEESGTLFIAMRYIDGTDLLETLSAHGPLPPEQAASIISQIAGALDVAHAAGIVHRDVKPANVLLSRDLTRAYLADFGLTKRFGVESGLTQVGQFLGTFYYAAPEQLEGKAVDGRADLYALGCVLYECLTTNPPFTGDMNTIVAAHLTQPPPALSAVRTGLPAGADEVIARAMAKRPDDRYQTGAELAAATTRVLSVSDATVSRPASVLPPPPPSVVTPAPPAAATSTPPPGWTPLPGSTPPPGSTSPPGSTPPPGWTPPPGSTPPGKRSPLPFVLFGGLAALALVVVLLVVFVFGGGDGGEGSFPTDEEDALLREVPSALRSSCERGEAPADAEGVVATVACEPGEDVDQAVFTRFESRDQLTSFYDAEVDQHGVDTDSPDCATFAEAEHEFETEDARVDRVLCYRDGRDAFLTWADEELRIAVTARSDRDTDVGLYTWWSDLVGRTDLVDALLAHVPTATRGSCEPDEPVHADGELAVVTCSPPGVDAVFYTLYIDSVSLEEVYETILSNFGITAGTGPGCGVSGGAPSEQGWTLGGVTRGRVACFFTDDDGVGYVWTHDEILVLSEAFRGDGDRLPLSEWWESADSGPE